LPPIRNKFLEEHTHSEDEVRFFVEGDASFYLRIGGKVYQAICVTGDLIGVPADTPHWFDMGPRCAVHRDPPVREHRGLDAALHRRPDRFAVPQVRVIAAHA
jgi:gentisate 1,2-dioxygenase